MTPDICYHRITLVSQNKQHKQLTNGIITHLKLVLYHDK